MVVVVDVNLRFHAIFQSSAHVSRSPGDHNSPTMVLNSKLSKEGYYLIILLLSYYFIILLSYFLKKRRETNSEYLAFTIIYLPRTDRILQLKQQEYTIPITGRKHLELGERDQVEQNLVSHSLKNYLFRCGLSGSGGLVERLVYIWDNWAASIKSKKVKGDQFTRENQHQVTKVSSV